MTDREPRTGTVDEFVQELESECRLDASDLVKLKALTSAICGGAVFGVGTPAQLFERCHIEGVSFFDDHEDLGTFLAHCMGDQDELSFGLWRLDRCGEEDPLYCFSLQRERVLMLTEFLHPTAPVVESAQSKPGNMH